MDFKRWADRYTKEEHLQQTAFFNVLEYKCMQPYVLHWHEFFELEMIVSGKGKHLLNGTEMTLSPGSLFVVAPTDFHEVHPDPEEGIELINVKFAESFLDEEVSGWLYRCPVPLAVTLAGEARAVAEADCRTLLREQAENRERLGRTHLLRGTLTRLLIGLLRAASDAAGAVLPSEYCRAAAVPGPVRQALHYIELRYRDPLTLSMAADHVGLSASYFSDLFHRHVGRTFQQYVLELRLQYADKLLQRSDLPITEVGYMAGFSTLPYFNRAFKRFFGRTPNDARKRAGTAD
ncbi:AraC family transcriptional regulator [Paenibacillus koleovorans]|uniref:AraC family transcriptional regulator n=1 Tax=Paenibacillus koleovorans TaxID=121608 RepID=UPI0013E326C6|nr:AraC family transcriptional regulator [Paenibacillus koleovorans]